MGTRNMQLRDNCVLCANGSVFARVPASKGIQRPHSSTIDKVNLSTNCR